MNEHIIALIKQNTPQAQIDPQPNTLIIGARSPETAVVVSRLPLRTTLALCYEVLARNQNVTWHTPRLTDEQSEATWTCLAQASRRHLHPGRSRLAH